MIICEKCGCEIDPSVWDDCEVAYSDGDLLYCKDCFCEMATEWAQENLDRMAQMMDYSTVAIGDCR